MTSGWANFEIAGAIFGMLAIGVAIGQWADGREKMIRAKHDQEVASLQSDWSRQAIERSASAAQADAERHSEHVTRFQAALGGPAQAAKCDPNLTIQQMLEAATRACAPADASVSAHVDRFTEFEVKVRLNQRASALNLANIAACVMRVGGPYIKSLVFIYKDRVIGELDSHAIESVGDWTNADASGLQKLLLDAGRDDPSPRDSNVAARGDNSENETNATPESKSFHEAQVEFQKVQQNAFERMSLIIKTQNSMVDLNGLRADADFETRKRKLEADQGDLEVLGKFLLNPVKKYRELLQQKNVDSLAAQIFCRQASERAARARPNLTVLLDSIAARRRAAEAFLQIMRSQFAHWSIPQGTDLIEFQNPATRDLYRQAKTDYEESTRAMNEALAIWNKAQESLP